MSVECAVRVENFAYVNVSAPDVTYLRYTLLYTKYYTYVYAKMRYLICLHVIWKGRTGGVNGASLLQLLQYIAPSTPIMTKGT